jgi:hypothetical protein
MKSASWMSRIGAAILVAAAVVLTGCGERVTRDEFNTNVMHKSTKEVAKRFGDPVAVENGPGTIKWVYTSKTLNVSDTGWSVDPKTIVVFTQPTPDGAATAAEVVYEEAAPKEAAK